LTDLAGTLRTADDAAGALSVAKIKRRIYTTSRNGVYYSTFSTLAQQLVNGDRLARIRLWPPETNLVPDPGSTTSASYAATSILDLPFGLPLDTAANPAAEFTKLQTNFLACLGSPLPSPCTGTTIEKMKAARREARVSRHADQGEQASPGICYGANP